ncbi:type II secretion system F family protein, partial [Ralstonia pseudosolanacearum]
MNTLMIGFLLSVFVAIALGVLGAYQWWSTHRSQTARRLSHRLETALLNSASHNKEASILKQRVLSDSPEFARLLQRLPRIDMVDRFLLQSGLDWSVGRLLGLSLASAAIVGGLVWLLHPLWVAQLSITLMGASLPLLYVL